MDNNSSKKQTSQQLQPADNKFSLIHESQILPGTIKPRHLSAETTMKAGDIYYVDSNGKFKRLAPGTVGQKLTINSSGLPSWA